MITNTMSITDLREDIDNLTERLDKWGCVVVYKNRKPLFIAIDTDNYEIEIRSKKEASEKSMAKGKEAVDFFRKMAKKYGKWNPTKLLIDLRDQEYQKWKQSS